MTASDYRIRRAAIATLGTQCLDAEALASELEGAGIDLGDEGVDRLEDALDGWSEFIDVNSGWLGVAATLDGTRWITTVDADDASQAVLALDPDLMLLAWWSLDAALTLGETGEALDAGDDVLTGPPGWLDPYAGGHVEVRIVGTALQVADEPTVAPAMTAAVRAAFDQHATAEELHDGFDDGVVDLTQVGDEDLLWQSLAANRDAFTAGPIPPVDRLLEAAGLIRERGTVLRAGADLEALHRWHRRNRIAGPHRLDDQQVDWVEVAIGMSLAVISGEPDPLGTPEEVPAAAALFAVALDDPAVCRAFLGHHLEAQTLPGALAEFVQSIVADLPADQCAGVRWLEGRALDLTGDPLGAIAAYERAVATGEDHRLALIGLAGFRADAGDALEAAALLRRAGITIDAEDERDPRDDEAFYLLSEVAGFAQNRPPARAGRTDKCPCGSGRKYKVCHLGQERHELLDRGSWLYDKAQRYLREHDRAVVAMIADDVSVASGRDVTFLLGFIDSPLVADIALCELGLGEAFVFARNEVLPDDEALLAAQWALVERSLFEVEKSSDTELRLRDLRSGERITVTNTSAESQTHRGELLLGRPLPIADTWRAYSGFVKVNALRDEVLAALDNPDPATIAELVGRCIALPQMRNTDGDPLEFHELVWNLPDAEAARGVLDAHDELTGDDGTYSLVRDTAGQPQTVILTLTIDGNELRADANSERRADEVIALVDTLLPAAELIDHDLRELDEVLHAPRPPGEAPARNLLDDPEMADLRAEIAADLEARWLDDHVPALGGLTPREAALDPIARHDLERLLDSFDGRGGVMNVARLRKALDL